MDRLRESIEQQQYRLRAAVPVDRQAALVALVRAQDRLQRSIGIEAPRDLVTGQRRANLGGNIAVQYCLESDDVVAVPATRPPVESLDSWGTCFLQECNALAKAELVLAHCESGFMRIVENGDGAFIAWIAGKRVPASWRERADFDWWAMSVEGRHLIEMRELQERRHRAENAGSGPSAIYGRLANVYLKMMEYQLGYPRDAVIGDCTVQTYCVVLAQLIGLALQARDRGGFAVPQSEQVLVAAIASTLEVDPDVVGRAVAAFTLDRDGAAYHAAVPGIAAAPLVRLNSRQVVWSEHGLTTGPFLFLTRELKRRSAEEYHNTAYLREDIFRQDLYRLFHDKRFVTSTGRIQLRRADGDVRTDIDAVIFDRKTGTLGLFEMKSQDPFARSTAELARQRDNVLYANRQISGALDWLKRNGADALLGRVDRSTAKTFRAQKVYPFVLGRYLAHFSDGPEPDRRAAWGTWPQVLNTLDGQPVRATDANPIASLFSRLTKEVPLARPSTDDPPQEMVIGTASLIVHSSYAALQASAVDDFAP